MPRPPIIGIVGAGNVLWAYLQSIDRLIPRGIASLGAVVSRNLVRSEELRSRRPGIQLVDSIDALLVTDVDIVAVITPPDSHSALARRSLESGKHLLVEKPLAETVDEARALSDLAQRSALHLSIAPFVAQSRTFQSLWRAVANGEIGRVHSARALYGNAGSNWARWYHAAGIGPMAEIGIYNLKSLVTLLGPVCEVVGMEARAHHVRHVGSDTLSDPMDDVHHLLLRHADGAISSLVASYAIGAYRRPAIELYGAEGTANLLGDDWDPRGVEVWTANTRCWSLNDPEDATWLWTDGIATLARDVAAGVPPDGGHDLDIHLIDILGAARRASASGRTERVQSTFDRRSPPPLATPTRHAHDHTRPINEQ